jgi:iron complex outermembrane receptor protein
MKQVILLLAFVCGCVQAYAQFTLEGKITGNDNEVLHGAHVVLKDTPFKTVSDSVGHYALKGIKPGRYLLQTSFIGYDTKEMMVNVTGNTTCDVVLIETAVVSDAVIISAVRASTNTPTTFTLLNREEITKNNLARDLPYLLSLEPSVVTTSDAGAGVGYTGLRIRGSDITRINVTINGIPMNDPESHAVYWVDIPDIASSVNSLQLQRGVGSSTNGAGAFGASMNLETSSFQRKPYCQLNASAGSYKTWKTTLQAGTGLIDNHWYFEGRASAIGSAGYIDRASSKLGSYFLQGGYYHEKMLVKAIVFSGNEKTYQAWYGIDKATLKNDRTFNWAGAIFEDDGSIRFYDNQTDNYRQDHYQLHVSRSLIPSLSLNFSGHYTYGRGYYEEYRQDEDYADYGLRQLYFGRDSLFTGEGYRYFYHDSVFTTDLIRRRWLDNHYYGLTWSLRKTGSAAELILGGAINAYDPGRHYGEIIWARTSSQAEPGFTYYDNTASKKDFNVFFKAAFSPVKKLTLYGDLQYRHITYEVAGTTRPGLTVNIQETFDFINPKAGVSYQCGAGTLYASYSIAHREPIRDDYLDALPGEKPSPETLGDLEIGIRRRGVDFYYAANYFLMNYINQLVLTGEINDDGEYIRKNTGKSYRTGVEFLAGFDLSRQFSVNGNLALSINRTNFRSVNEEGTIINYDNVNISFSPWMIGGAQLIYNPVKNIELAWQLKYVSKQYLDNTGNEDLMLDDYLVNDLRIDYTLAHIKPEITMNLQVYNLFNNLYESNGYVWGTDPYYYPQAGIHFMAGISMKF